MILTETGFLILATATFLSGYVVVGLVWYIRKRQLR